jgi:hypothetical protein
LSATPATFQFIYADEFVDYRTFPDCTDDYDFPAFGSLIQTDRRLRAGSAVYRIEKV